MGAAYTGVIQIGRRGDNYPAIPLGRKGENLCTRIPFDVSAWLNKYPGASVGLFNKRPGDSAAYPVPPASLQMDGPILTWTVTAADLSAAGSGSCELIAYRGETVIKSAIFHTVILDALDGSGDPPSPWESWQAELERMAVQVDAAIGASEILQKRITSLDDTILAKGATIEAIGVPVYVNDVTRYAAYGLTDQGWYVFARIMGPGGVTVTAQTAITGAAGYIAIEGAASIDVAVRFDTTAQSVLVMVAWDASLTETFVFKASDLAVRNLDYRVTFYIYDIAPYAAWSYALTADTAFAADKQYYTKDGDAYTLADVTVGDEVPADTYYNHSKVTFAGMVPNVTYKLDEIVDCPIEIVLPEVADDGHGAWFEIQMRYDDTRSCTLIPPTGVKIGTAQTQAQNAGINTIDLQYTVAGNVKMWTLLNTHSNIPA